MSEISLNVAPSPELLKTAAAPGTPGPGDRARPAATDASRAPDPFAALLAGVLQGAQPAAESASPPASNGTFTELLGPIDPGDTTLLALPGTAPPLAGTLTSAPAAPPAGLAGNGLPATGKELPLPLAAGSGGVTQAAALPAGPGAETDGKPATADRPRVFLGDLAQSRPLQPATDLPAATGLDGSRNAALAAAAALPPATGSGPPASRLAARTAARAADVPLDLATRGTIPLALTSASTLPAVTDALPLSAALADLARNAGLPVAGTELPAGQLAAFAAGSENSTASTGTASITTASTGTALADASSAALLSRLGITGLPALQPLGASGAFASGLADRLLTLGGPGAHSARLKLHPEHLGELDVEITMDDGTAQVWFGTTTSQARDAIEGSLPKLREMFADQGIQLTRTQIDSGGGQPGHSAFGQERRMTGGAGAWSDAPAWQAVPAGSGAGQAGDTAARGSTRLLDVWA